MTVQVHFSTPNSQVCWSSKYGCELTKTGVILLTSESFVKLEVKQVGPRFALIHARLKALEVRDAGCVSTESNHSNVIVFKYSGTMTLILRSTALIAFSIRCARLRFELEIPSAYGTRQLS
jgi:hypothetical protein